MCPLRREKKKNAAKKLVHIRCEDNANDSHDQEPPNCYLRQNFPMKRFLLCCVVLISLQSIAQNDSSLMRRLDEYMMLNKKMDFEKLMDYIHPNLFNIASKEQMAEMFKSAFDNEALTIRMDSLSVIAISPSFSNKGSLYRKVDYYISLSLKFKDSSILKDDESVATSIAQMKSAMDADNVKYIKSDNRLQIDSRKIMIAIKDNAKEWMFLGYEAKQSDLMQSLVPVEVLKNFKL